MKIKDGFVLREIADTIVAVPTGDLVNEFEGIIDLNSTGKFIWELLENDISIEEVINKLMEKYNVDEDSARKNAEKFIDNLRKANIIEE